MKHQYLAISIVCLLSFTALIVLLSLIFPNENISWLMHCTKLMLQGKSNYTDYFETNPPLILLLNIPAVFLSNELSLSGLTAFYLYLSMIIIGFLIWCTVLLNRNYSDSPQKVTFLICILAMITIVLPLGFFGERDMMTLLFFLPYLLVTTLRLNGHSVLKIEAALAALFAAIGISLKIYFLFPLVFVEAFYLYSVWSFRNYWRPEPCVILSFMVLYIASIFLFEPNYIHLIFPLVTQLYIPGFWRLPIHSIIVIPVSLLIITTLILIFWHVIEMQEQDCFLKIIGLSALGFYFSFILPGQLWFYHVYPAIALSLLGLSYMIYALYFSNTVMKKLRLVLLLCILPYYFVISFFMNADVLTVETKKDFPLRLLVSYFKKYAGNQTVLMIGGGLAQEGIRDSTQAHFTSRFPGMVLIPGIEKLVMDGKIQSAKKFKKIFMDLYMEDIKKHPPAFVIFADPHYFLFDDKTSQFLKYAYQTFFLSDQRFRYFFSHYHLVHEIPPIKIYRVSNADATDSKTR